MKSIRQSIYFVTIALILSCIYSCHPTYYYKITDISDPTHPCFSISRSRVFPWAPGMGNIVSIDEVDSKGKLIKRVWAIDRFDCNKNRIKKLCYGTVPSGYKELSKSIPIEMNKYYSIYSSPGATWSYFKISRREDDINVEVYKASEFFKKIVNN